MRVLAISLMIVALVFGCAKTTQVKPDLATLANQRQAIINFNKATSLLKSKKANYFKAMNLLEEALTMHPKFFEAHYNLALLYARGNQFEKAKAAYLEALKIKPGNRRCSFMLANLYLDSHEYDSAVEIIESLIENNPNDFEARNTLAVIYRTKGNFKKAIEQARYVLDRDPKQPLAYNNLATIFSEKGQHEMAQDLFRRALSLDSKNAQVLNNLGLAKLKWQKVQESLELFLKSFELQKKKPAAGLNAASVYMDNADYDRAARIYRKIIRHSPGLLDAMLGQAVAERGQGKFKKAEQTYQQILGLNLKNPNALYNLGILYKNHRDKPAWACQAFRQILESKQASGKLIELTKTHLEDLKLSYPKECAKGK
jgi:Tfp pilus assembly protein PilF